MPRGAAGGSSPSSARTTTALALFLVSSYWYTQRRRRRAAADRRRRRRIRGAATVTSWEDLGDAVSFDGRALHEDDATDGAATATSSETIGPRGRSTLNRPTAPHWSGFLSCLRDPCDAQTNPEGHIALCVAENKLVQESLATRLMQPSTAYAAFSDSEVYCYNGFLGLPSVREAVSYFLAKRFLLAEDGGRSCLSPPIPEEFVNEDGISNGPSDGRVALMPAQDRGESARRRRQRIDPDHVALGAGCASLLSHLMFILADPGDAVLIPAPYYASFENDLQAISACVPYPVHMENPLMGPTVRDLESAQKLAEQDGLRVKVLLLTNPNDPLGVVYDADVLLRAVQWARQRRMHVCVDEIYALSVHKKHDHHFKSILRVLDNQLGNDVHFLWGLSKDFGASGFRVGVLYTQNNLLLASLSNLNIFSGVSHPMQMIVRELLIDDDFVDAFLDDARAQLSWSYKICTTKLEEMVIPYVPAEAGIFIYVDFSSLLPSQTFEGEEKFATLLQEVARIVLTPGGVQRERRPGWFRLCYAWVSLDVLEIAMERLSYLVTKIRRYHWDDLDASTLNDVIKIGGHHGMRRTPSINLAELTRNPDRIDYSM